MPNVGISGEFFKDNKQFGEPFPDTGGWACLYNAGAEIYYRNVALGFHIHTPASRNYFLKKSKRMIGSQRILRLCFR